MTQTVGRPPRQRRTGRYLGIVYGIPILDPDTREVLVDYVGKTRQLRGKREAQHRDEQPWSDLIVGESFVIEQGLWTEPELDAVEERHIRTRKPRPRYNWLLNEDNPDQIPKWRAREERWARDDAAGRPRWVPPDLRGLEVSQAAAMPSRWARLASRVRSLKPWQQKVGLFLTSWLTASLVLWGEFARLQVPGGWKAQTLSASLITAVVLVWSIRRKPKRRRRRK